MDTSSDSIRLPDPVWHSRSSCAHPLYLSKPDEGDIGQSFPKSSRLAQIVVGIIALIICCIWSFISIPHFRLVDKYLPI